MSVKENNPSPGLEDFVFLMSKDWTPRLAACISVLVSKLYSASRKTTVYITNTAILLETKA